MTALPAHSGGARATRDDWLELAVSLLARRGVEAVTVLDLSQRLGVSRSSFYWHFRDRNGLIDALLQRWDDLNARSIVKQAETPARTVVEAVLNVFRCWVDAALFSPRLDLAVREWAHRSEPVRQRLGRADTTRMTAIEAMFRRHGYLADDALVRARVLYTMQLGCYALDLREGMEARVALAPHYLQIFTGVAPSERELSAFRAYALSHRGAKDFDV
jgi:AcrR family transcriptional regulator